MASAQSMGGIIKAVTGPGGLDKHQGAQPPLITSANGRHQG